MFTTYPRPIDSVPKQGAPDDDLILYGLPGCGDTASSASPASTKVELFLRLNGLAYTVRPPPGAFGNKKLAPKNKLPNLKHGNVVVPDSIFILRYLKETYGDKVQYYKPADKKADAVGRAAEELCHETLYFSMLWYRWMSVEGQQETPRLLQTVMPGMPELAVRAVFWMVRSKVDQQLFCQGMGRHSQEDINYLMADAVQALAHMLGEQQFITGASPTKYDCSLFAIMDLMLYDGYPYQVSQYVKKHPNLVAYVDRIRAKYFPKENPSQLRGLEQKISSQQGSKQISSLVAAAAVAGVAVLATISYYYFSSGS